MREELTEAVVPRCSAEKALPEIQPNQQENTCAAASLSTESQAYGLQLSKMETPAQASPQWTLQNPPKHPPDRMPPVAASELKQIDDLIKKIYET